MMSDTQTQLDQDLAEATEVQSAAGNGVPTAIEPSASEPTSDLPESSAIDAAETAEAAETAITDESSRSAVEVETPVFEHNGAVGEEAADEPATTEAEAALVAEAIEATDGLAEPESPVAAVAAAAEIDVAPPPPAMEPVAEIDGQQAVAQAPTDPDAVPVEFDAASPEALAAPVAAEPAATESAPAEDDGPQRLAGLEERVAALAEEVKAAANRATFLGRVRRLMAQIPEEIGEQAAALRARLGELEREILEQIEERTKLKEAIVVRAEALANSNEWKATGEAMRGLFEQWKAIGSAGHDAEDALWKRFQAARDTFSQRRNEWFEGRQKEWAANREKKEALCVRAEEMSESTEWRPTADAMRGLMAEWKTIGSAGRESDDALWSRFRAAQQIFFDRRSATYDENRRRKEELCVQAETEQDSSDWRATAETMKGLQAAWKDVGPVGSRDLEDQLWTRFRAATQAFFERRGSSFAERDRDEADNLRRKEELCVAAEALAVAADPVAATEEAKALQAEWKTIGPVRRDRGDALWARFRGACDRVFENAVNERARRQVAWSLKMREALERKEEQLARLEEAISHDEATVQRWQASLATRPDDGVAAKIADTTARIAEKRARAADLKASIDDIRAKMKS
jgi:hypothetical protein